MTFKIKKMNKVSLLSIYFLQFYILIILDLVNGLTKTENVSIALIIRTFYTLVNLLVLIKYGNKNEVYFVLLFYSYFILQSIFELSHGINSTFLVLQHSLKISLYIVIFLTIKSLYSKGLMAKIFIEKILRLSLIIIPLSMILFKYLGIANVTQYGVGRAGSFLATNAINYILILFFIISLYFLSNKKITLFYPILILFCLLLTGTKSSFIFVFFIVSYLMIFNSKNRIKSLLIVIILGTVSYYIFNLFFKQDILDIINMQNYNRVNSASLANYLFSGRNIFLKTAYEYFKDHFSIFKLIFGCGYTDIGSYIGTIVFSNPYLIKGIEMDLFEAFFPYGIVGVYFSFYWLFKSLFFKYKNSQTKAFMQLILISTMIYSLTGGHVLTEALSSSYLGIFIGYAYISSK